MTRLRSVAFASVLVLTASAALAERVALVIGNSTYRSVTALPNASTDAQDVAARLSQIGFAVHSGTDLTRAETLALVEEFSQALQPDDLALFYYAGHGAQIGAENYLIPVDATASDELTLTEASVRLDSVMRTMELRADRRIVILDACRNNPFLEKLASRALNGEDVARGLAKVDAGVGSYIAFSTQPGNVALDGNGRNSPFTGALLRHIGTPGADIHAVMRKVRSDVVAATRQTQVPWENSSLVDEIYLAAETPADDAAAKASISQPDPALTAATRWHYVGGLDPDGDGFLALRSGTSASATRLAKMPEGTRLEVLSKGDPWWEVRTEDGQRGFAHSNWIKCCTGTPLPSSQMTVGDEGASCEDLWYARNLIWHDYGYCFTTDRAIRAFGNDQCQRSVDRAAIALTMSSEDRAQVDRILAEETRLGCN
jgi:uncharacterized caspase-like protein